MMGKSHHGERRVHEFAQRLCIYVMQAALDLKSPMYQALPGSCAEELSIETGTAGKLF